MVKETPRAGQKPTKPQIKEIRSAEKRAITYTEDAPQLTDEELAEFKQINAENRKKIPCTPRLSKKSLERLKFFGDGYTSKNCWSEQRTFSPEAFTILLCEVWAYIIIISIFILKHFLLLTNNINIGLEIHNTNKYTNKIIDSYL